MPRRARVSTNHSNSSGGSTGSATTVTVNPWQREPRAGEVPVAEVRQCEHHAVARVDAVPTCSMPVQWKCALIHSGVSVERRNSS